MDIRHILVATDLTAACAKSYPPTVALARAFGSDISLITVDEWTRSFSGSFRLPEMAGYHEQHQRRVGQELRTAAGMLEQSGGNVQIVERQGKPSKEILQCADELSADLIVITRQRHRALQHGLIGSNAKRIIRHLQVPLLMVPGSEDDRNFSGFHHLVTTTDFSMDSHRGLGAAVDMAKGLNARLTLAHIYRLPAALPEMPGEQPLRLPANLDQQLEAHHRDSLQRSVNETGFSALEYRIAVNPSIAGGIIEAIATLSADLAIIPSHGKGTLRAALLGSNSEQVLRLSPVPVMILPRAYLEAQA